MKKIVLLAMATVMSASVDAQNRAALYDSTQVEKLSEVVVRGVRAQKNAPYAVSNIKKKNLATSPRRGASCLSSLLRRPASWHGARTAWEQEPPICASVVPATRVST